MEERRALLVANQRLRLELDAARARDSSNPRVRELEAEVRRLRHALDMAAAERDRLRAGVSAALDRLYSGERRRGR
jgi:hypothetical protein